MELTKKRSAKLVRTRAFMGRPLCSRDIVARDYGPSRFPQHFRNAHSRLLLAQVKAAAARA
jgi:hypothetical protein